MKIGKPYHVLGTKGYFFNGEISGTICFVPIALVQAGKLNESHYVLEGWASLNIKAQEPRNGVGSHLFPNLEAPCTDINSCERAKTRMEQLRPQTVSI